MDGAISRFEKHMDSQPNQSLIIITIIVTIIDNIIIVITACQL